MQSKYRDHAPQAGTPVVPAATRQAGMPVAPVAVRQAGRPVVPVAVRQAGKPVVPGVLAAVMLAGLLLAACTAPAPPAATPTARATAQARQTWETELQRLIAAARQEGTLVISSPAGGDLRDALTKAFQEKYDVRIEFITGRANELASKIISERRAGVYVQDLAILGTSTAIPVLKPEGALEPVDKQLFLPEVIDKKAWWNGDFLWLEPDHRQLVFLAYVETPLVINTELVKPGEIKGYRDLLNPKWKGRISIDDPTLTGAGQAWFQSVASEILDLDYMRQMVKQEPIFQRDGRLEIESLAEGKYAIQIGAAADVGINFKRMGSPIDFIVPVEGAYLSASLGGLSLLNRAPHPNAAKLFMNWLLTREGATTFSRAHGTQTTRVDVPTDFLEPARVRKPGQKYTASYTLEFALDRPKYSQLAKEMFGIK